MEKICLNCGKKYEAKSRKSKYCCEKCKAHYKYHSMKKHDFTCKFCGKEFSSYRLDVEFCCKSCAASYSKKSDLNLYKITEYIKNNPQVSLTDLSKNMRVSNKTVYKILNENGFHSYMEFVGIVKGVYLEKKRSDCSISALTCFDLCSKILNEEYVLEKSFDGLVNPKTNYKLKFDCYFPKSNILVEYNGIQHYKYVPFFHTEKNPFEYQQYKDSLKAEYCIKNDIRLVVISYKEELTIENIKYLLSRDNQQPSQTNTDKSSLEGSTTNE